MGTGATGPTGPTRPTGATGASGATGPTGPTGFGAVILKDSSSTSLPGKNTAWIGNASSGDGATDEEPFEFLMPSTVTFTNFYCHWARNNGSTGTAQSMTFQVFDANGSLVSGGSCVIAAQGTAVGSATGSNTSVSIALTAGGQRYAVKVTYGSGNLPGNTTAYWALSGQ